MYRKLLKRMMEGKTSGAKRMGPHYANQFNVDYLLALKSGKYRMFYTIDHEGPLVVGFTVRGDKTVFWQSET